MEKEVEKEALTEPVLPKLAETPPNLGVDLMAATLALAPATSRPPSH